MLISKADEPSRLFVGAVTAFGVAAVAALEMIGRGEDEVRALVVEVFREEFVGCGLRGAGLGWGLVRCELGGIRHC
jgi:hypothetical protein